MAVAPTIGWGGVNCVGYFHWESQNGGPGDLGALTATIPTNTPIDFWVGTLGAMSFIITGDIQDSGLSITNLSSTAQLAAGQLIQNDAIPYVAVSGQGGEYPATITAVFTDSLSLTCANGIFDEDENGWTANESPLATVNGATLNVTDYEPVGELAAVVSPGTGVTITDTNADGTGSVSHVGNGLAIMNLVGQAEGGFRVSFADTGSYTVTAMFTTGDPNYQDITLAPPVNIVVT